MRSMPLHLLAICAAAGAAVPQGVLPLEQTMRFGAISATFAGPCGGSTSPSISGDEGQVTFLRNGTCTVQSNQYGVCPGGIAVPGPNETGSGHYEVRSDGVLTVQWLPNQPGVDEDMVMLRADGAVMVQTRLDERRDESVMMIGIALSSGKSLASLNGSYHVVRLVERNPASGLVMQGDLGSIQFDGSGGYIDQGTRHLLPLGGTGSIAAYGPLVGTYTVDPDGTLATGVGALGALSPDGEVFFWLRRFGTDVSLTIGLRARSTCEAGLAAGRWHLATMANAISGTISPVELRTDWGTAFLQPTGTAGGTLDLDLAHVVTTPVQTSAMPLAVSDAFALSAQGQLILMSNAGTPMPGAVSAEGSMFAALTVPGDGIGLAIGLAAARSPTLFGAATPGSGGLAPLLLTMGGFPYVGNSAFGIVVAGGRGGTLAGLVLSGGASTGLPMFGGIVWLEPSQLLGTFPLTLSGTAGSPGVGAAAIPLPLPLVPELAGVRCVAQLFAVDPAAPQGIAMSSGLDLVICR